GRRRPTSSRRRSASTAPRRWRRTSRCPWCAEANASAVGLAPPLLFRVRPRATHCDQDAVPALVLGPVHRGVGARDQLPWRVALRRYLRGSVVTRNLASLERFGRSA